MAVVLSPENCLKPIRKRGRMWTTQPIERCDGAPKNVIDDCGANPCGCDGSYHTCGQIGWVAQTREPTPCEDQKEQFSANCSTANQTLCKPPCLDNKIFFTGSFNADNQIRSLALNYLLTDARDDDCNASQCRDPRGFWADSIRKDGFKFGSKLWTLASAKSVNETLLKAKEYAEIALRPLVSFGIATRIEVDAVYSNKNKINLTVTITGEKSTTGLNISGTADSSFGYLWEDEVYA